MISLLECNSGPELGSVRFIIAVFLVALCYVLRKSTLIVGGSGCDSLGCEKY